jgi:TetR/AcrR family transcriptional regulator, mexJK operon transcriptional repressor
MPEVTGRTARKRRAIMEAATTLFLRNGYAGTSMEEIATLAAVSKQTVYKHFTYKEQLFSTIVLAGTELVSAFADAATAILRDADDLESGLRTVARRYLGTVLRPEVLQLRRMVLAEARRLPELAHAYHQRVPERALEALGTVLRDLAGRGLLRRLDDPVLAATHFAFLIIGMPLDKAMFYEDDKLFTDAELGRLADEGVRVFLAGYRP